MITFQKSLFLINKQIENVLEHIDKNPHQIAETVGALLEAKHIHTTGLGKSAHIAQKCADTLTSVSISSSFIDPVLAFHGDLGRLQKDSALLVFSKSGNTAELCDFTKELIRRGNTLIILINCAQNLESELSKFSHLEINLPIETEGNSLNHVPMASCVVMEMVIDAIISELIERKGITVEQYARNHPGGNIALLLKENDLLGVP